MYKKINVHPGTRQVYADKLALQGVVSPEEAKEMVAAYRRSLESGIPPRQTALIEGKNPYAVDWSRYNGSWTDDVKTSVPLDELKRLTDVITTGELQAPPAPSKGHRRSSSDDAGRNPCGLGLSRTSGFCHAAHGRILRSYFRRRLRPRNLQPSSCRLARSEP